MRAARIAPVLFAGAMIAGAGQAHADPILFLYDAIWNVNGTTYFPIDPTPSAPSGVDDSGFDYIVGLGALKLTLSGAGQHNVLLYLNHDIDDVNDPPGQGNSFFNEVGIVHGTPDALLSWEIDDPSVDFGDSPDILDNVFDYPDFASLQNANGVPEGSPNDVAMALAWSFTLDIDEIAEVLFTLSTSEPTSGFYLEQFDPDSAAVFQQASIYFSSSLSIGPAPVPEPGILALLGVGLGGMVWLRRRRASSDIAAV